MLAQTCQRLAASLYWHGAGSEMMVGGVSINALERGIRLGTFDLGSDGDDDVLHRFGLGFRLERIKFTMPYPVPRRTARWTTRS